ncbi:MAG TPA: hypothetical protein PLG82_08590, partial [Tenuifilaceae bacterium]|nr:hypothetical protein [Tenuifilaceae bacterium]
RIGVFLIIGIVFTVFSPWLFTRNLGLIDFHSTGDIGSTIGGITAPITSLIGALLIYCALDAQKKANNIQSENNATQTLLSLILDLEKKCYDLVFIAESNHHRTGIAAFNSISSIFFYRGISPPLPHDWLRRTRKKRFGCLRRALRQLAEWLVRYPGCPQHNGRGWGSSGQRPYPSIRTPNAGETVGLSRNPPHWVHPLLPPVL